ncbi:MAG: DNA gyrase subunit A [Candidatus Marsarchaeota archaeon]|jgi:DNA gyrase subunit A|nr:DNA gyrase subunit A [Candidatus Marsarchaeota archaeon]
MANERDEKISTGADRNIVNAHIEAEMQSSYIDYAMSVIIGRALPDVRDGLKPVQRRILYAMYKLNNVFEQPTKKSARITGETIGKYHPHGDVAVYEAIVRMAQDFSMNYPLIVGQGNMGSIDGDPPAAQRYTEVKLSKISGDILDDIEKNSVNFVPNFDNTEKEPVLMPSKVPNLLVNGSSGIAVGVATNILPHNLAEVADAIIHYIDNRDIEPKQLLEFIKGPDFPTGGVVYWNENLIRSYLTGRGSVTIKGKVAVEKEKNREIIIITEIPYTVNKSLLVESFANLVKDKRVVGISDIRDESDKKGIRIVIELRQSVSADFILNSLYRYTQLQINLPVMNIGILSNKLLTFNIKQFISEFVKHRFEIIERRSRFDLDIATQRLHIVDGLIIAIQNISDVVDCIKKSSSVEDAKKSLIDLYSISEKQAKAILDMKLSKLTSLETGSLSSEKAELSKKIAELEQILADENLIYSIIKDETNEIKQKYGRERRTEISQNIQDIEINDENLISDEDTIVVLTKDSYVKRVPPSLYKVQDRGGKGVMSIDLKENDYTKQLIYCKTKDFLLVFTDRGRVHWLKTYRIPEEGKYSRGKAIVNLLNLENEKVQKLINIRGFENKGIVLITKKGTIKKMDAENFSRPRSNGIIAITIDPDDELVDAIILEQNEDIFIATRNGKSIKFMQQDLREIGRTASGVRGIRLGNNDSVTNVIAVKKEDLIVSVTSKGFGKITEAEKYRLQKRGGKGTINIKLKEKTGMLVKALKASPTDSILLINSKGLVIKFLISDIRLTNRAASGVKIMRLDSDTEIIDAQIESNLA